MRGRRVRGKITHKVNGEGVELVFEGGGDLDLFPLNAGEELLRHGEL